MEAIDVRDLPEPVARAIESMVQALRRQYGAAADNGKKPTALGLGTVPGDVIGRLTREEIYEDER